MTIRPAPAVFGMASRRSGQAFLLLTGLAAIGCAQGLSPRQMYDGAALSREQVGVVRSGCTEGSGLTIMTTQIDGMDIADSCADFALLPGEHHLELSAKQQSPKAEIPVTGSGMVFGRPTPMASRPEEGSRVVWASTSPLRITCQVQAGREVIIVGSKGMADDWQARCQEQIR